MHCSRSIKGGGGAFLVIIRCDIEGGGSVRGVMS